MVPCGRGVRSTVSLVVHRSVMSRCAGTHPLRPPLSLDRLVPEELHTSRMRHPPRNEQWPSSAAANTTSVLCAGPRAEPPCGRLACLGTRAPCGGCGASGTTRDRAGHHRGGRGRGARAWPGGTHPEVRATPGTHVPPVRCRPAAPLAEEPHTHGTSYARSATPATDPASRPHSAEAPHEPGPATRRLPPNAAQAPGVAPPRSNTRAPLDAPRRATARRTTATRGPRTGPAGPATLRDVPVPASWPAGRTPVPGADVCPSSAPTRCPAFRPPARPEGRDGYRTRPHRNPSATAWARSEAPSFLNRRRAWVFTVSSERNSSRPISALERP